MNRLAVNLAKLAVAVNYGLPVLSLCFLGLGIWVSRYFHVLTLIFVYLTVLNIYYLKFQKEHAILRNFGILGRLRYMLESIGPELRQYVVANDYEERPFNREERSEIYRKAKNINSAESFGSRKEFNTEEIKIRHALYPLNQNEVERFQLTFGEERQLTNAYTIHKHIMISAMSYGALGKKAIRALARGARQAGIPMNTGEGGYPEQHLKEGCDIIFQIGTAKFGVRNDDGTLNEQKLQDIAAKTQVRMIEIKLSQGAKPGKGGLLPKEKISAEIAQLRGVPRDRDIISPTHHLECTDNTSLVEFIARVQRVSELPTGIKMCIGSHDEFRQLVEEMIRQDTFPDYIAIDGAEGGTGAAPKAYIDTFGMPLLPALKGTHEILNELNVRGRLKLVAAGKLINPARQIIAMALGADAIYSARGFLLSIGCIQAMQCGNNTCPVGITTHNRRLQNGLIVSDKFKRVIHYVDNLEHEFYELLASIGCRRVQDLDIRHLYIPANTTISS